MRRVARAGALFLVALGVGACPRHRDTARSVDAAPVASPAHADANGRLDDLVREHLDASFAESPTTASWLGVHLYDDRLDDTSADAEVRRVIRLRQTLDRLHAIGESELDVTHRFDRALLEHELRVSLLEATQEKPLERNPVRYVDIVSYGIEVLLEHDTAPLEQRLHSIALRLSKVRTLLEESRRNLRNPPQLVTQRAIELGQSTRSFIDDTLTRVVARVADDKLAAEWKIAQADALRAIDDWLAWMSHDLLPRSHGELALGRERFVERLRTSELVDMKPEELASLGERELKATRRAFEETARGVAPGKTPTDAVRALEEDHPKAEDLLPTMQTALDGAITFVRDHKLVSLAETRPKVTEMPAYLWGPLTTTLWGPFEQRPRDAWIYVEPVDHSWDEKRRDEHLRAFSRPLILLATLHEAVPGHFTQREVQRGDPSMMQRATHSEAFAEGWAGYVEQMMVEEGYGAGDPQLRLAMLRGQLVRLCRLVAVVRFHALGVKLDEVMRMFDDEAYLDDYASRREAERVAYDPMSLVDALGRLEILKLREDWRRQRGEAFSLREFHDKLLSHGAPPPALLRKTLLVEGTPLGP